MSNLNNKCSALPALLMVLFLSLASMPLLASDKVAEVYELDDLDAFADSVAKIMAPAVVQAMTTQGVPAAIINTAQSIAEETFSAVELQSRIREELMMGLNETELDTILAWRKTALGDLLNQAENQHRDPDYSDKLRHYSVSNELYSVSDKRRLMVSDLYSAMNAIDQSVEMIINANYAMALATAIANGEETPSEQTMREVYDSIAESREQITIGVRGRMLVTGLYVYRAISDEDLAKYMEFNQTEAGAGYNDILFKAVDGWLFEATKQFGYRFGKALRGIDEQKPT